MLSAISIPLPSPNASSLLAPPAMVGGGTPRTPRSRSTNGGGAAVGGGAAQPPPTATLVEYYNVCNSLDNKHSTGYHSILGRGDVFGAYMDMRSTHIASTLLPPSRTAFVDSDGRCEVLCHWKMVPSVTECVSASRLGPAATMPASSPQVANSATTKKPQQRMQTAASGSNISLPNEYLTKLRSVDCLWEALGIAPSAATAEGGAPPCGTEGVGPAPHAAPPPPPPPRALFVITTFQHTSVYAMPVLGGINTSTGSVGNSPSPSPAPTALGPELLQTWTIPNAGRRCTANAVTIMGAMVPPLAAAALSPNEANASGRAQQPQQHHQAAPPTTVMIACEAMMVLGFERGDVLFCGIASERIHRRVNCPATSSFAAGTTSSSDKKSPTTATSTSSASSASFVAHQLIPHPVACITEIQSSAQNSLRTLLSKRSSCRTPHGGAAAQCQPSTDNATSEAQCAAGSTPWDDRCESIYAIGFDDGSILVCTVTMSCAAPTATSMGGGGGGSAGSGTCAQSSWSVQLRHHINFGSHPIHCIAPSIPSFFELLWSVHSAQLAHRWAASAAAAAGSQSASLTDPPTLAVADALSSSTGGGSGRQHAQRSATLGDTTPSVGSCDSGSHHSSVPTTTTTLSSLHLLYGADADWDEDVPAPPPAPPSSSLASSGMSPPQQLPHPAPLVPVASPLYAAIAAEGGSIYIVELPTLEKRTSVSNLIDDGTPGGGCGDYFTLQWISRGAVRGSSSSSLEKYNHHNQQDVSAAAPSLALQPELLVAGGASDELNVFAIGDIQRGQFRRAYAPPTAWGVAAEPPQGDPSALASNREEEHVDGGQSAQSGCGAGVSLRLVQRLPFHRNWINRICLLPIAMQPPPTSSLLSSTVTDGCGVPAVLAGSSGGSEGGGTIMVVATSLDDTISFWPVLPPPPLLQVAPQQHPSLRRLGSAGGVGGTGGPSPAILAPLPSSSATPSPPDRRLNRPTPLQQPLPFESSNAAPSTQRQQQQQHASHTGVAEEPVAVVTRCHDDLVAASGVCSAGRFGSVFVTVCLRGRVRFWVLSDPQL